jgi:putative ABC transport system permease protein
MNRLVIANILHRPLRSIISILAVAIEVVMILSIVGIFMGMLNDQRQRTNGIGADLMMRPSGTTIFNGVGGSPMPIKDGEALKRLPHVAVVAPVITSLDTGDSLEILYGIDYPSFDALRPFKFVEGGPFQGPNDVIIDDVLASAKPGHHVGDTIKALGDHTFRISGIVEHGKGGRKLFPIDTMADLKSTPGKCSIFYIKSDDPANEQAIIDEIHSTRGLENFPVQTMEEWLSAMTPARLPGFNLALDIVTGIAVIIGFLVIFQSMYTAVLERTREIGILKSMGASKGTIVTVVLRETAVMAVAGVAVGIAATFGVRFLLMHLFPTQHFEITGAWLGKGAAIAFSGSLCGALYPAWIAARKDPIDALAYE